MPGPTIAASGRAENKPGRGPRKTTMEGKPLTQRQTLDRLLAEAANESTPASVLEILRILIESDMKNREAIDHLRNINYQRGLAAR